MLVAPRVTYPGVYIQEVPSDVRTIVGVDTATTAFIGRAKRGPVNQATVINSYGDFQRIFGGLWLDSTMGYAVDDFFLNGGTKAVIVRQYNSGDAQGAAQIVAEAVADAAELTIEELQKAATTAVAMSEAAATAANDVSNAVNNTSTVTNIGQARIAATTALAGFTTAGAEQDAAQAVSDAVNDTQTVININQARVTAAAGAKKYSDAAAAAQEVADAVKIAADLNAAAQAATDAKTTVDAKPEYTGLAEVAAATQAVVDAVNTANTAPTLQTLQDAANAIITDQLGSASQEAKDAADVVVAALTGTVDDAKAAALAAVPHVKAQLTIETTPASPIVLEATHEGTWGNHLRVRVLDVDPKVADALADQFKVGKAELFNFEVHDTETGITETFPNVTVVAGPRRLDKILLNESALLRATSLPTARPAAHAAGEDDVWGDNTPATNSKVEAAGQVTDATDVALTNELVLGDQAIKTGLYALEDADIFNLLCIPPYDDARNDVPSNVISAAIAYCKQRRAMLIVDPPQAWNTKTKAVEGFPMPGVSPSENAAIFFPRIKKPNLLRNNQLEEFAPGGTIAGVIARTDAARGFWKAPAGLEATLNGVVALSVPLTDAENGELNPLGVNCLRARPAAGNVVWGARTMVGDDRLASQWKYIPVRRTALYIEESLYRGIQWAVFEPNDEPLWSQLRLNIGVFMQNLFRQGAFQGQSAKDAYFVKCDATTTPQSDIDKGIVNIVVGFAPLKPAEFVVLYLQQIAGQLAV